MYSKNKIYRYTALSALLLILVIGCKPRVQEMAEPPQDVNGVALEKQMWEAMANTNMEWVAAHIAESFQSVHTYGPDNRAEELELIRNLNMDQYSLSDFETTRDGDHITISYFVAAEQTFNNQRTEAVKAARLSVWEWYPADSTWKWIAHANLKPIGSEQGK